MGSRWRRIVRFGAYSMGYSILVGALAGALYQFMQRTVSLLLLWLDLTPSLRTNGSDIFRDSGMIALVSAVGGAYFGAIIGAIIVLLTAVVLYRRSTNAATATRAIVLGVVALGWLANAAISPRAWSEVAKMIELGLVMLLAGWWLASRLSKLATVPPDVMA